MIYQPKLCSTCIKKKPFSEFYKDKGNKDGNAYECKECTYLRNKKWHIDNTEYVKERAKNYYSKNCEQIKDKNTKYAKTKQGILVNLEAGKRYRASEHGKAVRLAYRQSKHGKFIIEQNKYRKNLLAQAYKLLSDLSIDANSGNEQIFLAHNSLKETIQTLTDMVKKR